MTQSDLYTALRAFLAAVVPASTKIVQGQANRVPMPTGPDVIVMQAVRRGQMATTVRGYSADTLTMELSTGLNFQLDVYGPASAESAQKIVTAFRSPWGADQFKASGVAPLYCDDPTQMPLIGGEQQYIQRWKIECVLHGSIDFGVPQQSADMLITTLTEITHGI
jgi:hypothetical protein